MKQKWAYVSGLLSGDAKCSRVENHRRVFVDLSVLAAWIYVLFSPPVNANLSSIRSILDICMMYI